MYSRRTLRKPESKTRRAGGQECPILSCGRASLRFRGALSPESRSIPVWPHSGLQKVSAGNERPELIGGLTIQGKNHAQPVILQALQLVNGAEVQRFGVDIEKARDVRIEDVRIGQRDFEKNFARGIQISGSTDIQIQNSSIYASSTVLDGYGLFVEGNASNILQY